MKVLNQAETALVINDMLSGKAEVTYARLDNHEGIDRVYCTIKMTNPLKAFSHLFEVKNHA